MQHTAAAIGGRYAHDNGHGYGDGGSGYGYGLGAGYGYTASNGSCSGYCGHYYS